MKHIDADKLIAQIKELRSESCISEADDYYEYAKSEILDLITSLQQEHTMIQWHKATESPGKRRVLMAFTRKDLKQGQYVFSPVRLFTENVIPAECVFEDGEDRKQLPVAWAYYDDVVKNITAQMCKDAAAAAWGWWPDDKK